jgi:hypothetical protein
MFCFMRKIKYGTGSSYVLKNRDCSYFLLKTVVSSFVKKRCVVSRDSVPLDELNLSERKEVRV